MTSWAPVVLVLGGLLVGGLFFGGLGPRPAMAADSAAANEPPLAVPVVSPLDVSPLASAAQDSLRLARATLLWQQGDLRGAL